MVEMVEILCVEKVRIESGRIYNYACIDMTYSPIYISHHCLNSCEEKNVYAASSESKKALIKDTSICLG